MLNEACKIAIKESKPTPTERFSLLYNELNRHGKYQPSQESKQLKIISEFFISFSKISRFFF